MPELVLRIVESPHEGETHISLSGGQVEIGDQHAIVRVSGDAAVVEDRGSEAGTFVNEQPIHGPRVILPGDRIRVGLTVLELGGAGEPASRPPAPIVPYVPEHVLHHVPDHALVTPEPEPAAPPFRAEESPAAFVPAQVTESIGESESRLLAAWRDTHVKRQTHVAAFAILAVAGLAVGIWLGFH